MAAWLKANGGPPAVVIIGVGLFFGYRPLGVAIIVVGVLMWLNASPRFPYSVIKKDQIEQRLLSDSEFGNQCLTMAQSLNDLMGDSVRRDPRILNWATEAMRTNYDVLQEQENRHRAEIESRFAERYRGKCAWLLSDIHKRGLLSDQELWPAWSPHHGLTTTSIYDIPRIADALATVGHKLTAQGGSA